MLGKSRSHRRAQNMCHAVHISIFPPVLDKGLQLILDVLGLLSREPRDRIEAMITFPRYAVARRAIFYLGLKRLPAKSLAASASCLVPLRRRQLLGSRLATPIVCC